MSLPALLALALAAPGSPFVVKPYLQLGNRPALQPREGLTLVWQTQVDSKQFTVELLKGTKWVEERARKTWPVRGLRQVEVELEGLEPGSTFSYRLRQGARVVFQSTGIARKSVRQPFRIALFGDCGAGTPSQKQVAFQVWRQRPDFVFIPGDIVYDKGRGSEYATRFYPIYNSDAAPLTRSIPFMASIGNHDAYARDLSKYPDGLQYFVAFDQPLNGPVTNPEDPSAPRITGSEAARKAFLDAVGRNYPRTANFSFDYGNLHWAVLDGNDYTHWDGPKLRAWLDHDLSSSKATWKFVSFHEPGYHSSEKHKGDTWMRSIEDIIDRRGVDFVFTGHVHNYQRNFPMRAGAIDRSFDGVANTKPKGVIYIVSGAGGAALYDPQIENTPEKWQPFTARYIAKHSFTLVDVKGRQLRLQQVDTKGKVLDSITVTK